MIHKIISWNVNGIRALVKKVDMQKFLEKHKPDIMCFNEIKLSIPYDKVENNLQCKIKKYPHRYWNSSKTKKGYSGTAIFSNIKPLSVVYDLDNHKNDEGRVITLEFEDYYLVNVYTPNSGRILERLKYRTEEWDVDFRKYIKKLIKKKEVVICGDLNVAHNDIDIHDPKSNERTAGFTKEERQSFNKLIKQCKLVDTFRKFHPDEKDKYSYWTYMRKAREKNKGWRIDYFLVTKKILKKIKNSDILMKQLGSDHAPVILL
jgi:exodeoxyribonuclease-3